jgi:hypothetical protein
VLPAVEQSQDCYCFFIDREGDQQATLKSDDPQTWPDIVPKLPSLGGDIQSKAEFFDTLDISKRCCRIGPACYPTIKIKKVIDGLLGENDRPSLHALSFKRFA